MATVFSGIGAPEAATPDWEHIWCAEIDPFPCAVLTHRFSGVPNLGDVTTITEADIEKHGPFDVLIGGSPCFPAGALVLTAEGQKPIEDVAVGDIVWTHEDRWKPVTAVMSREAETVVVNGQGHNAMRCTPCHPFLAREQREVWRDGTRGRELGHDRWMQAKDLTGHRWATPEAIDSVPLPMHASLAFAYLAGLYLGDGHIARFKGKRKKAVILSVRDSKAGLFHERLTKYFGTVSYLPHSKRVVRLQLSRTAIAEQLLEFGEGAINKRLPAWVHAAPRLFREYLLDGVLKTDGCCDAPERKWRVTTVSKALAIDLRLLACGLGYSTALHFTERPATTVIKGRTVNQRDTWTVFFRKTERTSEIRQDGKAWGLVRSVTPGPNQRVYDLTVADDHSFICDGLVVHNCQDLSVAGSRAGLTGARSSLFHQQVRIFHAARSIFGSDGPRWLVWENVPGAFSTHRGRDFAVVVGALAGCRVDVPSDGWGTEGVALGEHGLVEWAVLDAQWFGMAQRRRRIFAVLDAGDWASRPPILLEPESLRGDSPARGEARKDVAVAPTLRAGGNSTGGDRPPGTDVDTAESLIAVPPVAFHGSQDPDISGDVTHPLGRNNGLEACIAFDETQMKVPHPTANVRRLTPRECERLQGFQDDWTAVEYRGKPASDGPRYKAIGNSMVVPVLRWICGRIDNIERRESNPRFTNTRG